MAKKKVSNEVKTEFPYVKELEGLGLILIGILGIGRFGPIGRIIRSFAVFLFGTWYLLFLVMCLLIGLIILIKRKKPTYVTSRLIGVYIIIVTILIIAHLDYINDNDLKGVQIIEQTINNVVQTFDNFSMVKYTGGGIIGALLSAAFVSMFDITGTLIVCGVFFIFGIIMLFDITLSDVFKFLIKPFKKKPKSIEEMAKIGETELDNKETEEDNKVVITNINELPIQKPPMTHLEEVTYEEKEIKNNEPYVLPPLDLLVGSKNRGKVDST